MSNASHPENTDGVDQFAVTSLWRDASDWFLAIDREAIVSGTVSLVHAIGVFQDGWRFDMPECDPLPPIRNIGELFSPVAESLTVSLAIRVACRVDRIAWSLRTVTFRRDM